MLAWLIRLIASALREVPGDTALVPYVKDSTDPLLRDIRTATMTEFAETIGTLTGSGGGGFGGVQDITPREVLLLTTGINGMCAHGQSLSVGATATTLLSTSQPYSNVMLDGGVKAATGTSLVPLVEDLKGEGGASSTTRGETILSGAANYATRVAAATYGKTLAECTIFASTAGQGGTAIAGLKKGTTPYDRLISQVTAAKTLATAAGKAFAVHAVPWLQVETNIDNGTTASAYLADFLQLVDDLNTDIPVVTGQSTPVHLLIYQTPYKAVTGGGVLQNALLEAVRQDARCHFVGPLYHLPPSDGVHMAATGYAWYGAYVGRAYAQLVVEGRKPDCIFPISAVALGQTVSVKFRTPRPLYIDQTTMPVTTDNGFRIVDDTGPLTITAQSVSGDTWTGTVGRALGANPRIRYALDYAGAGLAWTGGASGNLRDTTADTVTVNGVSRPLYHVAPAFERAIITIV